MERIRAGNCSIAVIGSGVAGLVAAYMLSCRDRVTLLEADHDESGAVVVSYDITRLMRLAGPAAVVVDRTYSHPMYITESVAAQRLLPSLDDDRVVLADACPGWGVHEDGAASGLHAAERLGAAWLTEDLDIEEVSA